MKISGFYCERCSESIHDDSGKCKTCQHPLTEIQKCIAKEHSEARVNLINVFLETQREPLIKDEAILNSIAEMLALLYRNQFRLSTKSIKLIFRNFETRVIS